MNIYSSEEARTIDRHAIKDLKIPGELLMGNAGRFVAEKAMKMLSASGGNKVLIIAGKGNNGGDGYVAALMLSEFDKNVTVISTTDKDKIAGDALIFHDRCIERNIEIKYEIDPDSYHIGDMDLIVDGLLGTGIKGEVKSTTREWIEWINKSGIPVLAIDIPSGISADNGQVLGVAVKANATVTMGFLKQGLILNPGCEYSGETEVVDIEFPDEAFDPVNSSKSMFEESIAYKYLCKPAMDTYKHKQGKVFVLAGSRGFTGAACLTSEAALRSGAGLVIAGVPESLNSIFEMKLTEVITAPLSDHGTGGFSEAAADELDKYLEWCDVVAIGPGIGLHTATMQFVEIVMKLSSKPIVIDADALVPFRDNHNLYNRIKNKFVITPHYGEASALMGVDKHTITEDAFTFLKNMVQTVGGVVVLKGAPTLTAFDDNVVVNTSGHQGLATGGSGDVLTGIIAGFIAQKMPIEIASQLAVFIHGKCADALLKTYGYRGLIAGDLLKTLPSVIAKYEHS